MNIKFIVYSERQGALPVRRLHPIFHLPWYEPGDGYGHERRLTEFATAAEPAQDSQDARLSGNASHYGAAQKTAL